MRTKLGLDKYIFVIVKGRLDDRIRVVYTRNEMVDSVDLVQHDLVRETLGLEEASDRAVDSDGC